MSRITVLRAIGVTATVIALFILLPSLRAALSLNIASVYMAQSGLLSSVPRHPYVQNASARLVLDRAISAVENAIEGATARHTGRLLCAKLRAHILGLEWAQAQADFNSKSCTDDSIRAMLSAMSVLQGMNQLDDGDSASARMSFQHALLQGTGLLGISLDPWIRAANSSKRNHGLSSDGPRYFVGAQEKGAWIPSAQSVTEAWSLLGFDMDENQMEDGGMVDVVLYWVAKHEDAVPSPNWIQLDGRTWREDVQLINLVRDSGFEWEADSAVAWNPTTTVVPGSFSFNGARPTNARLLLPNPQGGSLLYTDIMPVQANCAYLVGGWLTSDGGSPTLGIAWDWSKQDSPTRGYIDSMEGFRDLAGITVSLAVVPPEIGVTELQMYVGNWSGVFISKGIEAGTVTADNLFVLPFSIPGQQQCDTYESRF